MQQPWRPEAGGAGHASATFDEASMERSKSFVKALQELKNLRPQLYSASEYCEKSYLHSEQKQMVLDNLKDYAVRALVNAVDHIGTVAYKLSDLFEQQASEVSTLELKVTCLNQQVLTCQTYTDKEGLRQQQMLGTSTKYHKHYILPSNKRLQAFAQLQTDADQESKPRPYPSAKTLSWHLASESNTASNGTQQPALGLGETRISKLPSDGFQLLGKEQPVSPMPRHQQSTNGKPSTDIVAQTVALKGHNGVKHLAQFSSFDNPRGREIQKVPIRTKSMLSAFFVKHRSGKLKKISVR